MHARRRRRSNENMNRLLRQYFPKGTDLAASSQAELIRTALQVNQRPRKTLALRSPAELRGPGLLGVEQIDLGELLDATLEHPLRRVRTTRRVIGQQASLDLLVR